MPPPVPAEATIGNPEDISLLPLARWVKTQGASLQTQTIARIIEALHWRKTPLPCPTDDPFHLTICPPSHTQPPEIIKKLRAANPTKQQHHTLSVGYFNTDGADALEGLQQGGHIHTLLNRESSNFDILSLADTRQWNRLPNTQGYRVFPLQTARIGKFTDHRTWVGGMLTLVKEPLATMCRFTAHKKHGISEVDIPITQLTLLFTYIPSETHISPKAKVLRRNDIQKVFQKLQEITLVRTAQGRQLMIQADWNGNTDRQWHKGKNYQTAALKKFLRISHTQVHIPSP